MRSEARPQLLLLFAGLAACFSPDETEPCVKGDFGCECYPNASCNDGLVCVGVTCQTPAGTTGTADGTTSTSTGERGTTTETTGTAAGTTSTSVSDGGTMSTSMGEDGTTTDAAESTSSPANTEGSSSVDETSGSGTAGDPDLSTSTHMSSAEEFADTSDSSTGSPPDAVLFSDHFERPDSDVLGEGWIEHRASAFRIIGGRVVRGALGNFSDNYVFRPVEESILDVEARISFIVSSATAPGNPQVYARAQTGPEITGDARGYVCYVLNDGNALSLKRNILGSLTLVDLAQAQLADLEVDITYRLRLSVLGADPAVVLDCSLDQWQGEEWTRVETIHYSDDASDRIRTSGVVGFSAPLADWESGQNFVYDDFYAVSLEGAE